MAAFSIARSMPLMGKLFVSYNSVRFEHPGRPPFPPKPPPGRKTTCIRPPPRCSKEALAKLEKCEYRDIPPYINQDCCDNSCKDAYPRFDELYKTETDKLNRKYQQTWSECPTMYIAPREVCCYDHHEYEPMEKRVYPDRPHHPVDPSILLMLMCRNKSTSKCSKIVWPGCRKVRDPPRCIVIRPQSKCRKVCTPFPAFSECMRDPPRPLKPVECKCLKLPAVCVSHLL